MAKMELDIAEMVEETFKKHFGVTLDRLRELAEADKGGRCVVLPCKVGDTVWFQDIFTRKIESGVVRTIMQHTQRDVQWNLLVDDWIIQVSSGAFSISFKFDDFGKTVFLTHEEAEAALKAGEPQ